MELTGSIMILRTQQAEVVFNTFGICQVLVIPPPGTLMAENILNPKLTQTNATRQMLMMEEVMELTLLGQQPATEMLLEIILG